MFNIYVCVDLPFFLFPYKIFIPDCINDVIFMRNIILYAYICKSLLIFLLIIINSFYD